MNSVFADTFYFLALLNVRDAAHERAVPISRKPGLRLVTTAFVLLELADALCQPGQREEVLALWDVVENDAAFLFIPATGKLMERGRNLYRDRADKEWSMTDCISHVLMQDHKLTEALSVSPFGPCRLLRVS